MNIFVLSDNAVEAAQMQCDKHIVKMVTESAQMLSTAHRLLDGGLTTKSSKSGKRMLKYWQLDDAREPVLMKNVHERHPCTIWTMMSTANYHWHYTHYAALALEYEYRYGKKHGAFERDTQIGEMLKTPPKNLSRRNLTPFPLAMGAAPECIINDDPVRSYRAFYHTKQDRFKMVWTKRDIPSWFTPNV